jgi:GT2 family glycosyltransferase
VLVPMSVARQLGNIDASFEHAMGDTDYALRARAAGVPLYVASGFIGECANNPVAGGFTDRSLSLSQRWRAVMHRKGLPWRSWLHFSRRHGGLMWPFYFAWPYVRVVVSSAWPAR